MFTILFVFSPLLGLLCFYVGYRRGNDEGWFRGYEQGRITAELEAEVKAKYNI